MLGRCSHHQQLLMAITLWSGYRAGLHVKSGVSFLRERRNPHLYTAAYSEVSKYVVLEAEAEVVVVDSFLIISLHSANDQGSAVSNGCFRSQLFP